MSTFVETVTSYSAVEVYGGVSACLQYHGTKYSPAATTLLGLSSDDQKRCLISATAVFEALIWQGQQNTAGNPGTVLQWPRSNVTDRDGNAVGASVIPAAIVNGCFEMAAIVAANPLAVTAPDANLNVQSFGEGPAHVTLFAQVQNGNTTGLPEVVRRLVGQYLGATNNAFYGKSTGVSGDGDGDADDTSAFSDDNAYIQTRA